MPDSLSELVDRVEDSLESAVDIALNDAQRKAALKLPGQLLEGLWDVKEYLLEDLLTQNIRRWMVLVPHLEYDLDGYVAHAAHWLSMQV